MQFRLSGMAMVMLKSWVLAWEKPLLPGTLLVTVNGVCPVRPRLLPVGSKSHYGMIVSGIVVKTQRAGRVLTV